MTVVILAFEFPPAAAIGGQRSLKLAKYLPEFGITPVVVTTDRASLEAWFGQPAGEDEQLSQLPPSVVIHRVPCPRPAPSGGLMRRAQAFFSLGEAIGRHWQPQLLRSWDALIEQHSPAALFATIPPFSMGPLAASLARRSGLPLLVDFRDHWSQWCHNARPTRLHYELTLRRERAVVLAADAVVGVTEQLVRDLQRVHPQADAGRFHAIPNGHDGDLELPRGQRLPDPQGRFVIGYAGSFYYSPEMRAAVMDPWWRKHPRHWLQYAPRREDWKYRSPAYFFAALRQLLQRRPDLRSRIKVRFAGDPQAWLQAQVEEFGLQDIVEHLGRLSHRDCLEFEAACDALLVTSMKVEDGRDYCIAGKTFEYLTTGRPIIGVVTPGEQRDFLVHSGAAVVGDADDPAGSAQAIEALIDRRFVPAPDVAFLSRFHRRETARRVAALVQRTRGASQGAVAAPSRAAS